MKNPKIITVNDLPLALTHEHRGGLSTDPTELNLRHKLIDQIGGKQVVIDLVDDFYDRIRSDENIAPYFPHFETHRIGDFFVEWLGGKRKYSGGPQPNRGIDTFHRSTHITRSLANLWLKHMKAALTASPINDESSAEIMRGLGPIASGVVNADDPALPSHQLIKSCGGVQTKENVERDKLRSAAARGKTDVVKSAVAADPGLVHFRGDNGRTLLWEATARGRTKLVNFLLEQSANANLPGCDPASINLACSKSARLGTAVMVTPWTLAQKRGDTKLAAMLLEHGTVVDVFCAAYLGDIELLAAAMDADASLVQSEDPAEDFKRITPLHHAIAGGKLDCVDWLIKHGANVETHSTWLLTHAALQNRVDLVERLLNAGADPQRAGVLGPLDADDRSVADLLVARGFDINTNPAFGSMLWRACRGDVSGEGTKRIETLLEYGADVNRQQYSIAPLHYAARTGRLPVIELLLNNGADVHCRDDEGLTPLGHLKKTRAKADPLAVMKILIDHGADIDNRDNKGETLLFFFARRCDERVVKWMLDHGADAKIKNNAGKSPADVVSNKKDVASKIRKLLGE